MEKITSRGNANIKRICGLAASKKERDSAGMFLCEGLRLSMDAIRSGFLPEEAYITGRALEKYPEATSIAEKSASAYVITDEIAGKISDTGTPQGIFTVFKKLDNRKSVDKINSEHNWCKKERYVILSSLQDPGNMGAIMRACEAFGIDELIAGADCPDIYAPKTLRASMGGVFRLNIRVCDNIAGEIIHLKENGVKVFAAALDDKAFSLGGEEFAEAMKESAAVVIGNEGAGLSEAVKAACTGSVMIPMNGGAESLNAAVAAGILIWEMTKNNA